MGRLANEIKAKLENSPQELAFFRANGNVKFLFDHVRYHDCAETILQAKGWCQRVPSPPWSPDNNRPVEHAHGTTKRMFKEGRKPVPMGAQMQQFKQSIVDIVQKHVTTESIKKDVRTLPDMWRVIAASLNEFVVDSKGKRNKGVAGGWPPHYMT